MKPFFSYYGGKWRAANHYPTPVGVVVEPFAGSAGYSVRHEPEEAILVDAYEPIVMVWDYLIHVTEEEILSLPDLQTDQTVDDLAIPEAARFLIGFWIQRATTTPGKKLSAWSRSIGQENDWIHKGQLGWSSNARNRIALQLHKIRKWTVKLGDYTSSPSIRATWFVDPPYQHQERKYSVRFSDYERLASWCRNQRGLVIACDQDGADWLPFRTLREVNSTHGRQKTTKTTKELVWVRE